MQRILIILLAGFLASGPSLPADAARKESATATKDAPRKSRRLPPPCPDEPSGKKKPVKKKATGR